MARPAVPLPCRSCGSLRTRIVRQDPDPDYRAGPTVWRLRVCLDCEAIGGSAEIVVNADEVRQRLSDLARERYYDQRPVLSSTA